MNFLKDTFWGITEYNRTCYNSVDTPNTWEHNQENLHKEFFLFALLQALQRFVLEPGWSVGTKWLLHVQEGFQESCEEALLTPPNHSCSTSWLQNNHIHHLRYKAPCTSVKYYIQEQAHVVITLSKSIQNPFSRVHPKWRENSLFPQTRAQRDDEANWNKKKENKLSKTDQAKAWVKQFL